ncbi:MAG: HDIG domain-containing protein, partial [Spirochaetales bacterium]|nr:HDIG domain-containing protein [Spirochaetales bacterium]
THMKKTKADRAGSRKLSFFFCTLIMLILSVTVPILLKTNTQVQYKSIYSGYTIGEIAEKNVYAKTSIDLIDSEATQKAIEEARAAVLPVFTYSTITNSRILAKADAVRQAVANFDYEMLVSILGETIASSIMSLDKVDILSYAYDIVSDILKIGYFDESEIREAWNEGYKEITVSNLYQDSGSFEYTIELNSTFVVMDSNIREFLTERLYGILDNLSAKEAILLEDIIQEITEPNILYDRALTEHRRDDAEKNVDTVVISITKGQILIEADHVVNHEQMELLRLLSTQSNSFSFIEMVGHIIFDSIVLSIGLYVFGMFLGSSDLHFREHNFLLVAGFLISLVATFFLTLLSSRLNLEFSDSFLPIFFLPLFMTEVTGYKRIGFVSSFMLAAVMATLPTASIMTFFYCIVCSSVSVFLIRFFNRRLDMIYQWFFSAIACAGVSILFMVITQASFTMIFTVLLGTLINVSIAYILLTALLPVAEKVFNLPTIFRLYELAYGENPILNRLSGAAPGTYSHSVAVADLAEVGAKAIGANSLLARVGGLYHDIGKIEHPEYFIENQNGVNKHDDISPSLSVAVIKSHVKVGAEKGREAGLPIEIIKIIQSHHGNDIIAYFYNEALKFQAASADDNKGETVKASDFSYNADIPDFKECGIVMLADSIEAASRTVTPNASKYAKLIDSIFMGKIERGQLDDSNLTMNDIRTLSEAFVKTLVARNHSRIEYPDED